MSRCSLKLTRLLAASLAVLVCLIAASVATAQVRSQPAFFYPIKFLCGPSSEAFQEGIVAGVALTAINVLNPSDHDVRFDKQVSRALPYQAEGPRSESLEDSLGPLGAIEIECNEIRQMLPSQMTEEFRTGYLLLRANRELVVTVVYSARPKSGEISTLDVQRVAAIKIGDADIAVREPDLTITEIDIDNLRVRCPSGQGSCVAQVPVTVANIGDGDAGAFRVRTSFDPAQSNQVFRDFPDLPAGGTQTFQAVTQPGGNCFDPNCLVCAFVDADMVVDESDEDNNERCEERQG